MKHSLFPGALALTLALSLAAWAQPDLNNNPKAQNPENRDAGARQLENAARRQLGLIGITETPAQDSVITFLKGEMKARLALTQKAQQLGQGLRNGALADAQVTGLLNDLRAAQDDDKARRQKALGELEKTLPLAKTPKLDAWLTLLGLVGDGPAYPGAGGLGAMFGSQGRNKEDKLLNPRRNRDKANGNGDNAPAEAPKPAGNV